MSNNNLSAKYTNSAIIFVAVVTIYVYTHTTCETYKKFKFEHTCDSDNSLFAVKRIE